MTIRALAIRELEYYPNSDLAAACSLLKHSNYYRLAKTLQNPPDLGQKYSLFSPEERRRVITLLAEKHIRDIYSSVCENDPLKLLNLSQQIVTQRSADDKMPLKERDQYAKLILDSRAYKTAMRKIIENYLDKGCFLEVITAVSAYPDSAYPDIDDKDLNCFLEKALTGYYHSHELKDIINLLPKLEKEACKIANVKIKNKLLAQIALTYANDKQLSKAEDIAYSITDDENKTDALRGIFMHYIKKDDLRKAEEVATNMPDSCIEKKYNVRFKSCALEVLAEQYIISLKDLKKAERIANNITDILVKDEILYFIVKAYVEAFACSKNEKTQNLLEAQRLAGKISDINKQSDILYKIARVYLNENDLLNARKTAFKIQVLLAKESILHFISKAYVDADNLPQAKRIASSITTAIMKETALAEIASAYIKTANLTQAERLANAITNIFLKEELLFEIAKAYIKRDDLTQAERLANIISNASYKRNVLFRTNLWKQWESLDKNYYVLKTLKTFFCPPLFTKIYKCLSDAI